jgi:hypothetical protein
MRALQSVVVGRKNYLFVGSERGGRADFYSVVARAKRAGLNPFAYLRDLLRRIPIHPQSRIGELLPDVWNNPDIQSA